ncbi:cilia- and flagella-associated protein 74-like isoform X2 [Apostichopus japonicus]|uniref:cilia- and flagella-associated protein 74-like isoform X2 n=1 Tax=Stichopus japonicus TaxID=307972 RepID=UPI003AB5249B
MTDKTVRMEDQLPPPTATTGDLMASPDPGFYNTTGEDFNGIPSAEQGSTIQASAWMDSRIGTRDGQFQYEHEADLWSQSDDTSLTDEETISEHDQDNTPVSADSEQFSRQERLRMLALRKHIDSLSNEVSNKESQVQTTREELKKCRSTIEALESEQDEIYKDIEESGESGNTANVYRLESKHRKVCIELEAERELEMQLMEGLANVELELSKADLEKGRFLLAEEDLREKEQKLEEERGQNAVARAEKEKLNAQYALKRLKGSQRDHFEALKERDRKQRQALSAARRSRENVAKYINETVGKVRQQREVEEERAKEHMEKRVKTLLTLKTDIKANRENLKALQARNQYLDKKSKEADVKARGDLKEAGRNVEEVMLQKKKLQQMEAEKRKFHQEQRQKQAALLSSILEEEKQMKKRQKMYPQLFSDPKREKSLIVAPLKKKPLKMLKDVVYDDDTAYANNEHDAEGASEQEEEAVDERPPTSGKEVVFVGLADEESSDEEDGLDPYGTANRDGIDGLGNEGKLPEELAQPEFEGLWNKTHKPYAVPKDEESTYTLNYPSKMEKEIMAHALDKHRAGIVRKQIAAGREFKGCAFVSKPNVVHFKDFDVGKPYRKKIILTNVSYSVNFLKLLDLSEHLKDFVDLQFDPPGQMSAGMSCDMLVSFKPLINEDLFGEIQFLAQTGPFSVPVHCTTKKCDVSVDTDIVDFGVQVIGETLKKNITLRNKGAKRTNFEFIKITGMKQPTILSVGTSLGRMTTADESLKPETAPEEDVKAKGKKKRGKSKEKSAAVKPSEEIELVQTPGAEPEQQAAIETESAEQNQDSEEQVPAEKEDEDVEWMDEEDTFGLDGMRIGEVSGGEIGPFGSVKLEIIYQPTVPGKVDVDFELRFSDEDSSSIPVKSYARAIDVPVWVERQNVDLKICMFDRLYQDAIVINNRATTALRLTMEVCKELRNHLELLPKTAYIQAQSQFSVQMKFLPRQNLVEEGGECFDKDTGVLEAPMTIRVADQTAPVPFTVHAVVTSSDLEFDQTNLDFGFCTIHESVIYTVHLTNRSILSQKYGFVNLPEYVAVQPDDGFGTLLPSETVAVDIIFSPQKAKEYSFQLTCKSGIDRDFKLSCKAVGVHTPLELSHSVVHFAATALEDSSVVSFYITNSHTDGNEFTHPVPRVGQGPVAPVGPTSFEFMVPAESPLSLYPAVGTVKPGKKTCISVKFSPSLSDKDIREEAVRLATRNLEAKARREYEDEQAARKNAPDPNEEPDDKKNKKGVKKPKSPGLKGKHSPASASGPKPVNPPKPEDILPESDDYAAGRSSLLRQFSGCFRSYSIPCFIASGIPGDPGTLPYDINNTLYLHVHCPEVKPSLVAISNHGRPLTNFDEVSIGQRLIKTITIQNIADTPLDLKQSVLDCHGPFQVLNAIRNLLPDATHTIVVAFEPTQAKSFYEVLDIKCATSTLGLVLKGQGLQPAVKVSVNDGVLDLGYVLAGEEHTETFKLENSSTFAIDYKINLDSLTSHKTSNHSELPVFITRDQTQRHYDIGPANYNGRSVFDCIPCQGTLEPGKKADVSVTFRPDHPSELFADVARIELFGKQEGYVLQLKGAAKTKIMYVTGGDEISPRVESLTVTPIIEELAEVPQSAATPVLLTFRALSTDEKTQPASRQLNVGCVRTMAVSQKKNGEFFFDNLNTAAVLGFQVEPVKGMVDAGNTKKINITWSPPKGHNPNMPMETNVMLNVKGDVLERYDILLHALVITKEQGDLS